MRYLFLLLLTASLASCSAEKDSAQRQFLEFSIELDTVKIDAGEELIYVGWNLTSSGESLDGRYLYNFVRNNPVSLEVIDLENLKLDRVIPMDVDGPNGVGTAFVSEIIATESGNLIFSDGSLHSIFDNQFNRLNSIRLDKEKFITETLPEGRRLWFEQDFSPDGSRLVAFYSGQNIGDPYEGIIDIDFEQQRAQIFPLEMLKAWRKHLTTFSYNGQPIGGSFSPRNLMLKGDSAVFSVAAENKVYFLDLTADSLSSKTYQSQFTSPASTKTFPENVETEQEFQEINQDREKELRYREFVHDAKNQVYWRFTTESTDGSKIVLTAFSSDFEQLGETLLDEKFVLPSKMFVRDGMIYTYLNQNDEVYFVRLKPQIKN